MISEWREFAGSWWISDDRESVRYARRRGIATRETIDLVSMATVDGMIRPHEGFDLMHQMTSRGRCLRLPGSPTDLLR